MTQIHRLRDRTYSQIQVKSGNTLEPPVFTCLAKLIAYGPMRSGALAEAMCADPSTVSRQVAVLVERGLVRREADPNDGRISVLAATDLGISMAAESKGRRNAMLTKVMCDWTDDEREVFADRLERYAAGYQTHRLDFVAAVGTTDWSASTGELAEKTNGETA
jgi:DNA-binding MarR family transcriptional regulator